MTSVLAEAIREIAEAAGIEFGLRVEDTDISLGEVFVAGKLALATAPCWFVRLGFGQEPFKDYGAAMMYVRYLFEGGEK